VDGGQREAGGGEGSGGDGRPEGCVGVGSAVALGAEAVEEDPLVVPLREGLIRPDKFIGNEDEGEGVLAGGLEDLLAEPPVLGDVDLVVPDVEGVEEELEAAAVVLHLPNRPDVSDVDGQGRDQTDIGMLWTIRVVH